MQHTLFTFPQVLSLFHFLTAGIVTSVVYFDQRLGAHNSHFQRFLCQKAEKTQKVADLE